MPVYHTTFGRVPDTGYVPVGWLILLAMPRTLHTRWIPRTHTRLPLHCDPVYPRTPLPLLLLLDCAPFTATGLHPRRGVYGCLRYLRLFYRLRMDVTRYTTHAFYRCYALPHFTPFTFGCCWLFPHTTRLTLPFAALRITRRLRPTHTRLRCLTALRPRFSPPTVTRWCCCWLGYTHTYVLRTATRIALPTPPIQFG